MLVKGIVQGVGFRAFVRRNAKRLGIKGFVRNLPDGFTVEIVAEGPDDSIEQLVSIVNKGPPGAIIEDVEVEYEEPKNEFDDFEIRY